MKMPKNAAGLLLVVLLLGSCFLLLVFLNPVDSPATVLAKCLSGGSILNGCRGGYLVDFRDIMPQDLRIQNSQRMDTDGDGELEWVVFYYYDVAGSSGPIAGAVYDNDRGWPPVLFPYKLSVPDRDYLGEERLAAAQVKIIPSGKVPEILVWDRDQGLNIFRYNAEAKTEEWKPPEDRSSVYFPIGVFRGDSVNFNVQTKQVTVWDRSGFAVGAMSTDRERSQLTNKRVYNLIGDTYMNPSDLTALSAPTESFIEFLDGRMPNDVLSTQYPEKIILGFYKTLGGEGGSAKPEEFLTGLAYNQYVQGSMEYFGVPWSKSDGGGSVRITRLGYSTKIEEQSVEVSAQGTTPLRGQVAVEIVCTPKGQAPLAPVQRNWMLVFQEGKWKIEEQIP